MHWACATARCELESQCATERVADHVRAADVARIEFGLGPIHKAHEAELVTLAERWAALVTRQGRRDDVEATDQIREHGPPDSPGCLKGVQKQQWFTGAGLVPQGRALSHRGPSLLLSADVSLASVDSNVH